MHLPYILKIMEISKVTTAKKKYQLEEKLYKIKPILANKIWKRSITCKFVWIYVKKINSGRNFVVIGWMTPIFSLNFYYRPTSYIHKNWSFIYILDFYVISQEIKLPFKKTLYDFMKAGIKWLKLNLLKMVGITCVWPYHKIVKKILYLEVQNNTLQ